MAANLLLMVPVPSVAVLVAMVVDGGTHLHRRYS